MKKKIHAIFFTLSLIIFYQIALQKSLNAQGFSKNYSGLNREAAIEKALYGPKIQFSGERFTAMDSLKKRNVNNKLIAVTGLHAAAYTGSLLVLNQIWYADYPKVPFQTFNDNEEWLQVDKVGHAWSGYQLSRASYAGWNYAGLPQKSAVWAAGLGGFTYMTIIELLDAHSEAWGWSWGDVAANVAGSALFIGQNLGWKEERISFKFSFHRMVYDDSVMNWASNENFGTSNAERMLKDYNGQTYWLSANLKSFFKQSKLPPWLNLSFGYGATSMFGALNNGWYDEESGQTIDLTAYQRRRQWYLAPDIDFTRIPTKSKTLRTLFYMLNAFKMPAPTVMLSKGKLTFYGFYF